ncbi:hypothetical protein [Holzapfeliella sp. JNUCC 72]
MNEFEKYNKLKNKEKEQQKIINKMKKEKAKIRSKAYERIGRNFYKSLGNKDLEKTNEIAINFQDFIQKNKKYESFLNGHKAEFSQIQSIVNQFEWDNQANSWKTNDASKLNQLLADIFKHS